MLLNLILVGIIAALFVIVGALFGAIFVVLRREADVVVDRDRLLRENAALTKQRNELARRLSRRRTPIVPDQRKAS